MTSNLHSGREATPARFVWIYRDHQVRKSCARGLLVMLKPCKQNPSEPIEPT